jgi:cell division protein FtsA
MAVSDLVAFVDVGSARIKTLVGSFIVDQENPTRPKLNVLGVGVVRSGGIRKGIILDMEEFKKNLDESLTEAENMAGQQFPHVGICLSGTGIQIHRSSAMITIPSAEIMQEDVNRVLDMAQNGITLTNQTVLKIIPESFTVDLENHVKTPVGMSAKKLEVSAYIFTIPTTALNNVRKGFKDVGIDVVDVSPSLLTSPESVLTRRQKELGVVCIDIGSSSTGVTVFEEGALRHAAVIPVGGEYVSSDIALGVRVSVDLAEKLKTDYVDLTFCDQNKPKDEEIPLSRLDKKETETVSKLYLSQIAQARYKEILGLINRELKLIGKDGMLPEGAIFVGGGSKARNLIDLAKAELRLPCAIGFPEDQDYVTGMSVADPGFSASIGALIFSQRSGSIGKPRISIGAGIGGVKESAARFLKRLFP